MLARLMWAAASSHPVHCRCASSLSSFQTRSRLLGLRWPHARSKQGELHSEKLACGQSKHCGFTCLGFRGSAQLQAMPVSGATATKAGTAVASTPKGPRIVLIVESPTKAHKIQKYLGPEYQVLHCVFRGLDIVTHEMSFMQIKGDSG